MKASLFKLDSYAAFSGLALRTIEQIVIATALGPAGHGSFSSAKTSSILSAAVPWGSGVAASDRANARSNTSSTNRVLVTYPFLAGVAAFGGLISVPFIIGLNLLGSLDLGLTDVLLLVAGASMQAVATVNRRVTAINHGSLAPNVLQVIGLLAGLVVVGVAALTDLLTVTVAIVGYLTSHAVEFVLQARNSRRTSALAGSTSTVEFSDLMESFTFSQMLHMAVNRADILTLVVVLGPRSAGLYAVALAYVQPVQQYGSLLALRDATSLSAASGWSLAKPRLDSIVLAFASAGLALTTIPLVFGDEFSSARLPAVLLAFVSLLQVSQGRLMHLSYSRGAQSEVDRAELIGLVVLVTLTAVFASLIGIVGAVFASLIAYGARSARLLSKMTTI